MISIFVLAAALSAQLVAFDQQNPPRRPQTPAATPPAVEKTITVTGCVVPAVDAEDTFRLVPAQPASTRPVGTAGPSPAWTVPAYLLLGGTVSFAEHANKTVEITGTLEPDSPVVVAPKGAAAPKKAPAPAPARLHVQSAKVTAPACTPRQAK